MKTYTVHLIRHGLTQGTLEGRYLGRNDETLCDEGVRQLKEMQKDYGYPTPDIVVTGTLTRCIETAEILFPGKEPVQLRGFDECDFGEFEGHTADELKPYPEFGKWLAGGEDARPLNGESNREFATRVCTAFNELVEGLFKTGTRNVAVVTHGGVIMTLMAAFALPQLPMTEWLCPAGCGYTLRITPEIWAQVGKAETIADVPDEPLTPEQEQALWDYYPTEEPDNE